MRSRLIRSGRLICIPSSQERRSYLVGGLHHRPGGGWACWWRGDGGSEPKIPGDVDKTSGLEAEVVRLRAESERLRRGLAERGARLDELKVRLAELERLVEQVRREGKRQS